MSEYSAYANLSYVNELLNLGPDEYQTLGIYLPSLSGMDHYADQYYAELKTKANVKDRTKAASPAIGAMAMFGGGESEGTWTGVRYSVTTLDDLLSSVKQIVNVFNSVALGILIVLFVIIMVGILNTFRMTMFERIREIGTMRALGMQREQIRNLFLLEALFLGVAGLVIGLAAAGIIMGIVSLFNLGPNSPLFIILRQGHFSFKVPLAQGITNVVIIALLTLAAAYLPARAASRLSPAQALRTTK